MDELHELTRDESAQYDAEYQQWLDSMEAEYENEQYSNWVEREYDRFVAERSDADLDRLHQEWLGEHFM